MTCLNKILQKSKTSKSCNQKKNNIHKWSYSVGFYVHIDLYGTDDFYVHYLYVLMPMTLIKAPTGFFMEEFSAFPCKTGNFAMWKFLASQTDDK